MKKITLPAIFILFLSILAFVSCTEDTTTTAAATEDAALQNSMTKRGGSVWDGAVGVYDEASEVYKVTADERTIMMALEEVLTEQGIKTELETLEIIRKEATNEPGNTMLMMIGNDQKGTSIGVVLEEQPFGLVRDTGYGYTTCKGCATGCNLQYFTINGKKVPYCNENGCVYDCEKSETK